VIDLRKLAAVDLAFLGPKVILIEFALGILGPLGFGVLTLIRSQSAGGVLFGAYLVSLSLNYIPMLAYAISLSRRGHPEAEFADELGDRRQLFRKYRRQSLVLLVPIVPLIVAASRRKR
jgi:hypothetical protein